MAHPGLVSVAKKVFDENMKGPNQIQVKREDVKVTAKDLLALPKGTITEVQNILFYLLFLSEKYLKYFCGYIGWFEAKYLGGHSVP